MSPRSILKSEPAKSSSAKGQSHVHFPPLPTQLVSATFYAYPAAYYDRTPVAVAPNECALPRRNCPDRTYVLCDREARLLTQVDADKEQKYHADESTPRPYSSQQRLDYFSSPTYTLTASPYYSAPPRTVPDLTWSESEDSDALISPPVDLDLCQPLSTLSLSSPAARTSTRTQRPLLSSPTDVSQDVLSFLPHPPLPPHERKRSLSPRNRERKDRTSSSSDSDRPTFTTSRPKPFRPRYSSSFGSDIPPDSGCFGGF